MTSAAALRRVQVWDLPTRIFHWLLVALIIVAWLSADEEGASARIHFLAGEIIAGMLVFRVVWGFAGGEHARFSDFLAGPKTIMAHVRDLLSPKPKRHLGHNPLGGLAVLAILLTTGATVATGLFSGEDEMRGPFAGRGRELGEAHEAIFTILQVLIAVHIIGVLVETLKARDPLVRAMITGWKPREVGEPGADARRASWTALVFALAAGLVTTVSLASITPAASSYQSGEMSEEHERDD